MSDTSTQEPEGIQQLRDAAAQAPQFAAERDEAKRELAFVRAGIDTESRLGQMFFRAYTGELTTDAIRAEALEVGAWKEAVADPPPADPGTAAAADPNSPEMQQQAIRDGLGGAPATIEPPKQNAIDRSFKTFDEARAAGRPHERALQLGVDELIRAGLAGDPTAMFSEANYQQEREAAGHGEELAARDRRNT